MTAIPDSFAEEYDKLKNEISWLHAKWIIFNQLFSASEKRIDLLNESAATFFYIIQEILIGEIQVFLSKLTDPARKGRFDNLSLEKLQALLVSHGNQELAVDNRKVLDQIHLQCEPFRIWRNKRLAHLDMNTAMRAGNTPLPNITKEMIDDALALIRQFMNNIEGFYNNAEHGYEHFIMHSDGEALVVALRDGMRYEELIKDGTISFNDPTKSQWYEA